MRQPPELSDGLLRAVSEVVGLNIGLHFPRERWPDMERGIVAAARELAFPDTESFARALISTPLTDARIEVLSAHLTVGETYFFRDRSSFAALEEHILPQLLHVRRDTGRRLRIWSAGCCTGEEPYSVAIVLERLIPDCEEWDIVVLATDINPRVLERAAQGAYGEWSFRGTPEWIREQYFTRRRDGRWAVHPRIRRRVTFARLNLAADVQPWPTGDVAPVDVILCRNVLMYFTAERAQRAAANFRRALGRGGWLVVSPAEASNTLFAPLAPVHFPEFIAYRNDTEALPRSGATGFARTGPRMPSLPERVVPPADLPPEANAVESAPARVPAHTRGEPAEHVRAARRCAGEGRLDEAAQWCARAIEADRLNPAHYYLLAVVRQEQGQIETAAQSLTRALYLDPDFALAHHAIGNLRLAQGRRAEAERHLANALALLRSRGQDEPVAEADGLTAGRLAEIIASARAGRRRAAA